MTGTPEDWAIDSNEALQLTLFSPAGENPLTFHPDYTYPIFGDTESIYGYKDLKINLSFAAWDMSIFLKVSWKQKLEVPEVEDIAGILEEYLPEGSILALAHGVLIL